MASGEEESEMGASQQAEAPSPDVIEVTPGEKRFGAAIGIVYVGAILAFVLLTSQEPMNEQKLSILKIVLAVSAAAMAALIPGLISVRARTPTGMAIRAGGAIAFAVMIMFLGPEPEPPCAKSHVCDDLIRYRKRLGDLNKKIYRFDLAYRKSDEPVSNVKNHLFEVRTEALQIELAVQELCEKNSL